MLQSTWAELIRSLFSKETALTLSISILILGVVLGYLVWRTAHRILQDLGVPETVESTPFERTVERLGTSTVDLISHLAALFVYVSSVILALNVAQLFDSTTFWTQFTLYVPRLFTGTLALIVGLVVGDKAKLLVSERLKSVKLPEVSLLPKLVKYSVLYIFALIALGQLGVATEALLVLLRVYALGLVALTALAFWDLLRAGAAGIYILLAEPYSIGDEVRIDDNRGIVQEVDMFTTRIESEGEEYIVPNQRVFRSGIVRIRN
jgi:small-conductance mechanosensitive channel